MLLKLTKFANCFNSRDKEEDVQNIEGSRTNDDGKCKPLLRQTLAISGPIFLIFVGGIMGGFSSILVSQMEQSGELEMTTHWESWIASAPLILTGVACLVGGWWMDKFGRTNTILLTAILLSVSYVIVYLSRNIIMLLVGRMITGFCVGFGHTPVSCYLGEICTPKYRPVFNAFVPLSLTLSFLATDVMGFYFTWRTLALTSALIPFCTVALVAVVPESHIVHLKNGNLKSASDAFYWFRGRNEQSITEFERLLHESKAQKPGLCWNDIACKQFLKPFALTCTLFLTLQFSAINIIVFYSYNFVYQVIPAVNRDISVITLDLFRVLMTSFGCILARKLSLKLLLLICSLGTASAMYLLALTNFLGEIYKDSQVLNYLPLAALLLHTVFVNGGLFIIPWAIVAEVFNKKTKGLGSGLATCVNFLLMFGVIKVNPYLFGSIGVSFTLLSYATLTLIAATVSYVIMPETRNKTLQQIEEFYK